MKDDPGPKEEISSYERMFPNIADDFSSVLQSLKNGSSKLSSKLVFALIIGFVLVAVVFFNIGKSVSVDQTWLSKKSNYQEIIQEYTKASIELHKLKKEIASNSDLVSEINSYKKNKNDLERQISELKENKEKLESNISKLSEEVKDLTKEESQLTGEIAKAKGKGYTLTAGKYVGGDDIPIGTYNINWISGNGNVIVGLHGSEVNEIFGSNSQYGYIKSYKNCDISYGTDIVISGNVKVQFKAKD